MLGQGNLLRYGATRRVLKMTSAPLSCSQFSIREGRAPYEARPISQQHVPGRKDGIKRGHAKRWSRTKFVASARYFHGINLRSLSVIEVTSAIAPRDLWIRLAALPAALH